ncbi:MAG: hypothetical protein A2Z07_08815 [Armatimonadetes bacterium RBG_16_67_12]|nr:MAG: hypothetical protein A2Z07_08815 [Armatimonadetes bacterium RBG_16_67_12]
MLAHQLRRLLAGFAGQPLGVPARLHDEGRGLGAGRRDESFEFPFLCGDHVERVIGGVVVASAPCGCAFAHAFWPLGFGHTKPPGLNALGAHITVENSRAPFVRQADRMQR